MQTAASVITNIQKKKKRVLTGRRGESRGASMTGRAKSVPASWSASGGSKGWWWWSRTGRGGARAGALLALRIKAEDSRESPVEQLRRAEEVGRAERKGKREGKRVRQKRKETGK